MSHSTQVKIRTTHRSWFSASTMWVLILEPLPSESSQQPSCLAFCGCAGISVWSSRSHSGHFTNRAPLQPIGLFFVGFVVLDLFTARQLCQFTSGGQRTASKGPRFLSRGLYPLSHPCQPQVSGKVCGMMGSVFPVDPAGGILLQISQAWSSKAGQERI